MSIKDVRVPRWYFGGLSSAVAACFTHPLDTMKVYYQTSGQLPGSQSLFPCIRRIMQMNGPFALYTGLSASLLRQVSYSGTRFTIYENAKARLGADNESLLPLSTRVWLAGSSGAIGGLIGVPADVINVRTQHDIKLPLWLKRNYGNPFRAFLIISRDEGVRALFQGTTWAVARALLMSIGQLAMYEQYKFSLIDALGWSGEEMKTHTVAGIGTSVTCTAMTQPLDVLKTRTMNASHRGNGGGGGVWASIFDVYRTDGLLGFYKGTQPTMIRLVPHTVLVFVLYEQLRLRFGHIKTV